MMEDRKKLLNKLAKDARKKGAVNTATPYEERSGELQYHIDKLKDVLFSTQDSNSNEFVVRER